MKPYYLISATIGIALAAATATTASAQRHNGHEYGNDRDNLTLVCWGEGRRPSTNVAGGYAWDSSRHKFVPHTYLNNTTQDFDSEVQVELHGDWGRIHLTGKLVPPIHSGGNNGWWELENVLVGRETITARYRLNGLNKPRVEIDRRSGRIKIMGATTFRGECEQGNWGERNNRF